MLKITGLAAHKQDESGPELPLPTSLLSSGASNQQAMGSILSV